MPASAKTRVEVYIPEHRNDPSYRRTLDWIADEFTFVRAGGTSIIEGIDGRYLSVTHRTTIYERVSLVYSDFPTDWSNDLKRTKVTDYLEDLKNFAEAVLWQEETILVSHTRYSISLRRQFL